MSMECNDESPICNSIEAIELEDCDDNVDPVDDIIDYLVRCAKISFKNAHLDEKEVRTGEKIKMAHDIFKKSPTTFLMQFGKYLTSHHLSYFENLNPIESSSTQSYQQCVQQLKVFHSDESRHKRIRNRRFRALQKLQEESDYFSETEMMSRNPLLYEQLVGQYLTNDEIKERDGVDRENLTFLNLILDTVDRNQIREMKNEQMLEEDLESMSIASESESNKNEDSAVKKHWGEFEDDNAKKHWGGFDKVDTRPDYRPEVRKQVTISAPERRLLRQEFLQEMYSSFIEGRDEDVDYTSIDNDEQYDDLQQLSQDAEDRYFDSETNEVDNLEQHMKLVDEYGKKDMKDGTEDTLDVFMLHISNKLKKCL